MATLPHACGNRAVEASVPALAQEGEGDREQIASPLTRLLGLRRAVILHVDDLGMCHGSNQAFLQLAAAGLVTCGSVMVPCPWFREISEAGAANPSLDLGVHLTLTSEWAHYRWAPISTRSRASGLIDHDGYFWRDIAQLRQHLVPEAAQAELRAQIERALAAGLRPTHIDAHMAAAMLPELLDCHLALAREYGLVPVLPCNISFAPDPDAYAQLAAALADSGRPLPDAMRGTLPVAAEATRSSYRSMIAMLPDGLTHLALHCTVPGEIEAIAPDHAGWRVREYALFAEGAVRDWCEEEGVVQVGYRGLQPYWSAAT
ncbi:polysaccharide deacetylase family protein [Falsiroseomonas sp. HW251]|uniref:polysaccharide deacetylase family protein n=1 Tax=Falsiroseomonas sp. HW251 TaxID=3390998 RepID=UPI003D320FD5